MLREGGRHDVLHAGVKPGSSGWVALGRFPQALSHSRGTEDSPQKDGSLRRQAANRRPDIEGVYLKLH
ncbi:hypothetical protein AOLI_G00053640 [Acnodon oligacanthus]